MQGEPDAATHEEHIERLAAPRRSSRDVTAEAPGRALLAAGRVIRPAPARRGRRP
jgi:hypothetical protein